MIFAIYYINNLIARRVSETNWEKIEYNDNIQLQNIHTGRLITRIDIKVNLTEEDKIGFYNYIDGAGKGFYFNYNIILEGDTNSYKIKTIVDEKTPQYIILKGWFVNNILKEDFRIGLLQNHKNQYREVTELYYMNLGDLVL